jgi:hypothetical protein
MMGILLVLVGIGFWLKSAGVWTFLGLEWYTVGFLLTGICMFGMECCSMCKDARCCDAPKSAAKMDAKVVKKK